MGITGKDSPETYMVSHVRQSSSPVGYGKVRVSPPRVTVLSVAAPRSLGHVVVQVDVDLIGGEFGCYGIEDLCTSR